MALNTPYQRLPITQLANVAERNPLFALGLTLGNAYANNYNQRGINKSIEALQGSLGPTQEETMNAEKMYADYVKNSPNQSQQVDDYKMLNQTLDNLQRNGWEKSPNIISSGNPQMLNMSNDYANLNNNIDNINTNGFRAINNFPSYEDEQRGKDTIESLAKDFADERLTKFDLDKWKAEQTANLLKAGRTPEQIETAMNTVLPQAQIIDKQNKDAETAKLLEEYPALGKIFKLKNVDPEMAELFSKTNLIPATTKFAAEQAAARQQQALDNAKKLKEFDNEQKYEYGNKVLQDKIAILKQAGYSDNDIARIISGTKSISPKNTQVQNGSQKSIIGSPEFKFANERLEAYKEKLKETGSLTESEQQDFNNLSRYVNNAIQSTYSSRGNTSIDFNNYNQVVAAIQQLRNQGYNDNEILKDLKVKMGDGEMYRNIARTMQGR